MMPYRAVYDSPLGAILLASDGTGLTGLWFQGQKYEPDLTGFQEDGDLPLFQEVRRWLDVYFSGEEPDFFPPLHPAGTAFQRAVWERLWTIPYGETTAYGAIARGLGASAQAVGGAVGRNPISILTPCHRVVGSDGSLTGYAGGIRRKIALLKLEGGFQERFYVPKNSTAP